MGSNILVIEDDGIIAEFIQVVLEREHHTVYQADSAMTGITLFQSQEIDLILLDLGLPDMDGMELLKILRKQYETPIIVISARDNETGKVEALDIGADDYVTKPFGTQELLARIRTAMRHSRNTARNSQTFTNKELMIDYEKHLVQKSDQEIHLTKNEFLLLKALSENVGKVVTYKQLMTALYGPFAVGDTQVLRVNMSNIRKKIETDPVEPQYILTEIGVGYRMKDLREA
ncbi:response regulator transcription factor [Enterococcus sp. BWM-S5]|uniref:Response regulator transcription factor n=1 Tax=Enterococcus larvae TaxID=2794352 RepID=A0ABS4CIU3_9ENTE|nr:response regulator transcription factor [Enterococcus larvae]MBP1046103.1 response regulator transcription factor [Enterococcus larvae]